MALGIFSLVAFVGVRVVMHRLQGFVGDVQQFAQISQLDNQVQNQRPYRPATDQPLEAAQVSRYVEIQRVMLAQLGERVAALESKYQQLSAERGDRDPNLREMMGAWRDMVDLLVLAKSAQVSALNEKGMSLAEYSWIRTQVLYTLGHGFAVFDLSRLAGEDPPLEPVDLPPAEVRQQNLELLQPYLDDAEDWLPLSFFGL